ncbi:20185_t:CDS:2 [Dentiscutata erythropus]|uniref:20185_t:CDS:1 n=1 Tax=Dentiscutata erythropus TaxID=1348616 RepID=A0A9N9IKP4_9GLOM|nr:20185_t:CDS:2 [Dentiscutata erythropus]
MINIINQSTLHNHLSDIFDIVNSCDCHIELVGEYNQFVSKHNKQSLQNTQAQIEVASLQTRAKNYYSQLLDVLIRAESKLDEKQQKEENKISNINIAKENIAATRNGLI